MLTISPILAKVRASRTGKVFASLSYRTRRERARNNTVSHKGDGKILQLRVVLRWAETLPKQAGSY